MMPPRRSVPLWSYLAAALLALGPALGACAEIHRGRRAARRPDFRSRQDCRDRRDGAARPAAGQSGVRRSRRCGRAGSSIITSGTSARRMLALPLHISGWEADIGLAWFTAFASLTLTMALAVWLSRRPTRRLSSCVLACERLCARCCIWFFGSYELDAVPATAERFCRLAVSIGLGAAASHGGFRVSSRLCCCSAITRSGRSFGSVLTLALVVAASFESSAYVGGVTFAIAALVCAPMLLGVIGRKRRVDFRDPRVGVRRRRRARSRRPFIRDQFAFIAARGGAARSAFILSTCWARCSRSRCAASLIFRPFG